MISCYVTLNQKFAFLWNVLISQRMRREVSLLRTFALVPLLFYLESSTYFRQQCACTKILTFHKLLEMICHFSNIQITFHLLIVSFFDHIRSTTTLYHCINLTNMKTGDCILNDYDHRTATFQSRKESWKHSFSALYFKQFFHRSSTHHLSFLSCRT